MLGINMADVINVLMSVLPQLIVIGVVLVLAIIVTVAVNKKTVADTATRKLIHSESWLVFLVAAVVSVSMMLFGPLATLLNSATATKYTLSEETISNASDLAKEIQSEAITLLQNTDDNLPLVDTNVNVFGWASTNPVYGGTGSGSMNANYETTSILQGMAEAGLTTNEELSKLYTDYRADRPVVAMAEQDWTLPEVPAADYSQELIDSAKEFSDEAVIVIGRVGGEGADLPKNMKGEGITYNNNSTEYEDFEDAESFLELSKTEEDIAKCKVNIEGILKRKDKLLDLSVGGHISDEEFTQRNSRFNEEIDRLRLRLDELEQERSKNREMLQSIDVLRQAITKELDFTEGFSIGVIDTLLDHIEVHPQEGDKKNEIHISVYLKAISEEEQFTIRRGRGRTSVCTRQYT